MDNNGNQTDKPSKAQEKIKKVFNNITEGFENAFGNKAAKGNFIGFCYRCGSGIEYGVRFCTSCGTPVQEFLIEEAEEKRREAEEAARREEEERKKAIEEAARQEAERVAEMGITNGEKKYCINCGKALDLDAMFCDECGTKTN